MIETIALSAAAIVIVIVALRFDVRNERTSNAILNWTRLDIKIRLRQDERDHPGGEIVSLGAVEVDDYDSVDFVPAEMPAATRIITRPDRTACSRAEAERSTEESP